MKMEFSRKWILIGLVIAIAIATIVFVILQNSKNATEIEESDINFWHNMTPAKANEYAQIEKLRQDTNNPMLYNNPLEVFGGIALILAALGLMIHGPTLVIIEKNTNTKNINVEEKRQEPPKQW